MSEWQQAELNFSSQPDTDAKSEKKFRPVRFEYADTWKNQLDRAKKLSSFVLSKFIGSERDNSPEEDLGGGLRTAHELNDEFDPLYALLDDLSEKDSDLIKAYENLNVLELLKDDNYQQMKSSDRARASFQFARQIRRLDSLSGTLATSGNYEHHQFKHYGFEDDEEMFAYAKRIRLYLGIVKNKPAYQLIRNDAWKHTGTRRRQENAAKKYGELEDFYVVKDVESEQLSTYIEGERKKAA